MLYVSKKLYICSMAKKETIYASVLFDKESTKKIREVKESYKEQKINVSIRFIVNKLIHQSIMKILILLIGITIFLSACVPAHSQYSSLNNWFEVTDSTGNNLYTQQGDIWLASTSPYITSKMKSEIDQWLEEKNTQPDIPFKSGVEVTGEGWMANKDIKTGKWKVIKTAANQ